MSEKPIRTFFLLAVGLLLLASLADLFAKTKYSNAADTVAMSGQEEGNRTLDRELHKGKIFQAISYILGLLGVVSWITSVVRKERCHNVVLSVLLLVFLLFQMMFV